MCLSGESSDAIICRKSRIKAGETYCTKLLIPRTCAAIRVEDASRVPARKSETSRSSYKSRTLKLNSMLIWPTLFIYQKNCWNSILTFYFLQLTGGFSLGENAQHLKIPKSFERTAVIDAVILLVSVLYRLHVLWNQTSPNPLGLLIEKKEKRKTNLALDLELRCVNMQVPCEQRFLSCMAFSVYEDIRVQFCLSRRLSRSWFQTNHATVYVPC